MPVEEHYRNSLHRHLSNRNVDLFLSSASTTLRRARRLERRHTSRQPSRAHLRRRNSLRRGGLHIDFQLSYLQALRRVRLGCTFSFSL